MISDETIASFLFLKKIVLYQLKRKIYANGINLIKFISAIKKNIKINGEIIYFLLELIMKR